MDLSTVRITRLDVREVVFYRVGLWLTAVSAVGLVVWLLAHGGWGEGRLGLPSGLAPSSWIASTALWGMAIGAAIAVGYIHLYMGWLHLTLKGFISIGLVATLVLSLAGDGLAANVYGSWWGGFGYGFVLATLCGIAIKEMLCFGRLTTLGFALVTPVLALGHLFGLLSALRELQLVVLAAALLVAFAVAKVWQPYHKDVGDKGLLMQLRGYPLPPDFEGPTLEELRRAGDRPSASNSQRPSG